MDRYFFDSDFVGLLGLVNWYLDLVEDHRRGYRGLGMIGLGDWVFNGAIFRVDFSSFFFHCYLFPSIYQGS